MKKNIRLLDLAFIAAALPIATGLAHARSQDVPGASAAARQPTLVVAPYAWALNLSGTVGLNGLSVPLDLQSSELLRGVKRGGMGYLQWQTDKGFFYFEGLQIDFGEKHFEPLFNQSVKVSLGMGEIGYGWNFDVDSGFPVAGTTRISPYVGVRATRLRVGVAGPLLNQTIKESWTDPVLGVIAQGPLSQDFSYVVKLDASGFNTDGNDYRSAVAILRYNLSRHWALAAGYRASRFKVDTTSSGLAMDLQGRGPLVGLQLTY